MVKLNTDCSSNNSNDESYSCEDSSEEVVLEDDITQKSGMISIVQEILAFTSDDQTTEMWRDKPKIFFDSLMEEAVTNNIIIDCLNMVKNPAYNAYLGVENIAKDIFHPSLWPTNTSDWCLSGHNKRIQTLTSPTTLRVFYLERKRSELRL